LQQAFPCFKCGAQNYIGQTNCWNCQSKFQYNCPNCRAIVEPTMLNCPYCNIQLNFPISTSSQFSKIATLTNKLPERQLRYKGSAFKIVIGISSLLLAATLIVVWILGAFSSLYSLNFAFGLILFAIPLLKAELMYKFRGNLSSWNWALLWIGEFFIILLVSAPPPATWSPAMRSGAYLWAIPFEIACWRLLTAKHRSHWWWLLGSAGPLGLMICLLLEPKDE